LTISPEVILAADQRRVSRDETTTDGYSVFNLKASYVWAGQHESHMITLSGYNLTNELYRNHTSFIKDLAPELGRGFRVGYSVRFF
jgi:iron complex outermembrane receptor protein